MKAIFSFFFFFTCGICGFALVGLIVTLIFFVALRDVVVVMCYALFCTTSGPLIFVAVSLIAWWINEKNSDPSFQRILSRR